MKSVARFIETVIVVVVVIVAVLLVGFSLFGEHAIKVGIETAGTKALNVGVNIDELDLSVFKGAVGIKGLVVNNPPGYEHKELLTLGSGEVTTSLGSLMSDTVEVKSINLDNVNLVIEQKGLSNNLQDVLDSLPKTEAPPAEKEGKKLHVKELSVTNVKVKVKLLPVPGKIDTMELDLDPIVMKDLGSDKKLDTAKLASKVLVAIAKGVAKKGAGVLPDDVLGTMQATLDKLPGIEKVVTEQGKKFIEAGKKQTDKVLDTGKEKSEEIVEGIKGLIKPKKDE